MDQFHERDQKVKGEVSRQLSKNIFLLKEIFAHCDDLVWKEFDCGREKNVRAFLIYTDGLAKSDMLEESIIRPLLSRIIPNMEGNPIERENQLVSYIEKEVLEMADMKEVTAMEDVVTQVLAGNTILMVQGSSRAILISSKNFPTRGVQTADSEIAVRGPKDSFT